MKNYFHPLSSLVTFNFEGKKMRRNVFYLTSLSCLQLSMAIVVIVFNEKHFVRILSGRKSILFNVTMSK